MDARPHRPRGTFAVAGNENMATTKNDLHQRHKSTGNLAAASRAGGLQGAAKRTAFGDVSNLVKNLHNNPVAGPPYDKAGKAYDVSLKENLQGAAQGFSKPAQRTVAPAIKKSQVPASNNDLVVRNDAQLDLKLVTGGKARTKSLSRPNTAGAMINEAPIDRVPVVVDSVNPALGALLDEQDIEESIHQFKIRAFNDTQQAPPIEKSRKAIDLAPIPALQPRHHKSQPQLKESVARDLRRTQSRQVIASVPEIVEDEKSLKQIDELTEAAYEDAVEHILDEQYHGIIVDDSEFEELDHPSPPKDLDSDASSSATMPAPADIEPLKPVAPEEQAIAAAAASSEEYWDEMDEEEYDEQGYTTAHSYRSRGDLTTGGATTILAPKVNDQIQRELDAAKEFVERNVSEDEIEDEAWDVCMVAEYGEDIFAYLHELEAKMLPDPHYMDNQAEIQWSMRSILMDWLIQVHQRFSLLPETLFLAVNYIDRFLSYKAVSIGKLQLVGATALLVASKYEEINCPSLEEVVFMVDGTYANEEILKAERFMLSMLNFELGWPGPMSFLRRISKADDYDLETRTLAKYFLEVTIMDERFVACPASFLAAGAHCLSRMILKKGDWTLAHTHYSGYTWSQIRPLVQMILECCHAPLKHHAAVFDKYSDKRFKRAAEYVQEEISKGFMLPPTRQSGGARLSLFDLVNMDNSSGAVQYPASGL